MFTEIKNILESCKITLLGACVKNTLSEKDGISTLSEMDSIPTLSEMDGIFF